MKVNGHQRKWVIEKTQSNRSPRLKTVRFRATVQFDPNAVLEPAGTHFEMENTFGTRVRSSLSLHTAAVMK